MIRVQWQEPTFVCETVERDGAVAQEIHHADTREALEASLNERIARRELKAVNWIKAYDFQKWKARAAKARDEAIQAVAGNQEFEPRSTIWGDLKPFLIQLFHRKCAYCEADFRVVAWGDVEHYRPKGKITDSDGNVVLLPDGKPHPGYYWLAYDPTNLMPSCQRCNQGGGKMNKFPIAPDGARAACPDDSLTAERALLLNPYDQSVDPGEHIDFVTQRTALRPLTEPPPPATEDAVPGAARALTSQGAESIRCYRLNRYDLVDARARTQLEVVRSLALAAARGLDPSEIQAEAQPYIRGERPFSAAAIAAIRAFRDLLMALPT